MTYRTYGDYYFTPWGFFLTLLGTVLAALKTILTNLLQTPFVPSPASSPTNMSFAESLANITRSRRSSPTSKHLQLPTGPTSSTSSSLLPTLSLPPLHLLYLLSPLAFMQTTLLAYFTGELHNVWIHLSAPPAASSSPDVNANANVKLLAMSASCWWLFLNGVLAFFLNVVSFNANRRVGPLGMGVACTWIPFSYFWVLSWDSLDCFALFAVTSFFFFSVVSSPSLVLSFLSLVLLVLSFFFPHDTNTTFLSHSKREASTSRTPIRHPLPTHHHTNQRTRYRAHAAWWGVVYLC